MPKGFIIILNVLKRIVYALDDFICWATRDMTRKKERINRQSRRTRFEVFRTGGFFRNRF